MRADSNCPQERQPRLCKGREAGAGEEVICVRRKTLADGTVRIGFARGSVLDTASRERPQQGWVSLIGLKSGSVVMKRRPDGGEAS